jgi:hypothetical protein
MRSSELFLSSHADGNNLTEENIRLRVILRNRTPRPSVIAFRPHPHSPPPPSVMLSIRTYKVEWDAVSSSDFLDLGRPQGRLTHPDV